MATTFQFEFGSGAGARRRDGRTSRLLLLGDFGARAHRPPTDGVALGQRPVIAVDVDSLDDAVARIAPTIARTLDDGTAVDLRFAAMDDFHPDRLVERHAPLAALTTLRRRLLDPARFEAAAKELGAVVRGDASAPEDDRAALHRLLGDSSARTTPESSRSALAAVRAFIRRAGATGDTGALQFQAEYLAAVDQPATAHLRALLHAPEFQSLEAAWRGVAFLVSRLDLGEELELHLLDVTLDELRADAAQTRGAFAGRLQLLAEDAADADATWLFAGALFDFGAADVDVLESIGAAAHAAGIAFVAGADATLAGTCPDASQWLPPAAADLARWQALRNGRSGTAIGLVTPRLLLRLPYGDTTESIDAFPFQELRASAPAAAELLWGGGALAALFLRASDAGSLDIDDLPALTFDAGGERQLLPCAEWLIGERVGDRLIDHGLMPLLASRHRNAVRLAGFRSIAAR